MAHTPGPWKLVTKFASEGDVYGDAEIHAPSCYPLFQTEILDEWKRGDAYLIASAPELLDALKRLDGYMEILGIGYGPIRAAAREAIAKAEGR